LGLIPNTERFKNINHAETVTLPNTLFLRIDESLTFLNAGVIEQAFLQRVAENGQLEHLVIVASGIHSLDASGANMLKRFCHEMDSANISMYLTDVKVPLAKKLEAYGVFADKPEHLNQATIELYNKLQSL
jgi:SulP family sulfate permease